MKARTLLVLAEPVAPSRIQWQKTYGGDSSDRSPCLARTSDSGFLLGGHSYSGASGNKSTPNFGDYDFWVLRLDQNGNKVWEGNFGGWGVDLLWGLAPTSDGGAILVGESDSTESGNKTSARIGYADFWVVRLDANGNKLWDKSFGGLYMDKASKVHQTADGGFLIGGTVGWDYWVVRLNAAGQKLWDRAYGGLGDDQLTDLHQTSDGGFILAGHSDSGQDGDKSSATYGGNDIWLVRVDADGNKLWDRSYGGSSGDASPRIIRTSDGGFLVGANTTSDISGNKTSAYYGGAGFGDYWVLRLDPEGNKIWERDFGGTWTDVFSDLEQSLDGGFVLAGFSSSEAGGNKMAPRLAYFDLWIVRLDQAGTRIWDQTYTGFTNLAWPRLQSLPDGGIMMAAQQGDPAEPGTTDLVLMKLSADALTAPQLRFPSVISPGNAFRFQLSGISNRTYVTEFSSDLQNWFPLRTNRLTTSTVEIQDADAGSSGRFYRARLLD